MVKYENINRRFTEIVSEYLMKGYVFNTATMNGCSQLEVTKVDLTDGKEVVRIKVEEGYFRNIRYIKIVVGRCKKVKPHIYKDMWNCIWDNELEIISEKVWYEIGKRYGSLEDAIAAR